MGKNCEIIEKLTIVIQKINSQHQLVSTLNSVKKARISRFLIFKLKRVI